MHDSPADDGVPARFQVDFTGKTLLGTYAVERRIAEGGMGSVYLARDTSLGRAVVVKVPHARFLGEAGFRRRFRREIEELVRLEHPHVVRILARGEESEVPYFVLQHLGGGSLEDRLKAGPQTLDEVLDWLATVARTLDFIHGRGVVHRDVKPANILFDGEGHVFLSDFGVVKALGSEDGGDMTAAGTGIGSPIYMAPEQSIGQSLSAASDQYALGSTVFEALSGEPPFGRGSVVEILVRKSKESAPSLRARLPDLPPSCDDAIRRALAREPSERFPTCAAFAEAARRAVAPPATAAMHRPLPILAIVLGTLLAGLAGLFALGVLGRRAPDAVEPSPERAGERPARPDMDVRLVSAGEAPHRRFRYRLPAEGRDRLRMRSEIRNVRTADAGEPLRHSEIQMWDVRATVESVDEKGRARMRWLIDPLEPPAIAKGAKLENSLTDLFNIVGTLQMSATLDSRGEVSESTIVPALWLVRVLPDLDPVLASVEEQVRALVTPLPDEPIGKGAVWDVTRWTRMMGMRFQTTATFELVEVDGDRLRVRVHSVMTAPPQSMKLALRRGNVEVQSFHATTDGETVVALDLPLPVESTAASTYTFHLTEDGPTEGTRLKVVIEGTEAATLRRE